MNYIEDPYPITLAKDHDYEQQGVDIKEDEDKDSSIIVRRGCLR